MRSRCHAQQAGFSLIELLVVISLIGVLLGLLLPAAQKVRESAARAACLSSLRQIGVALHHHHDVHGRLPPLPAKFGSNDPNAWLYWTALILPEIDQGNLWNMTQKAFQVQTWPWVDPPHVGFATAIPLYVCPDDRRLLVPLRNADGMTAAYTSYTGVAGDNRWNGVLGMYGTGIRLADITDGTSQTLMVGERPPPDTLQAGRWYSAPYSGTLSLRQGPEPGLLMDSANDPNDTCVGPYRFGPGRTNNPCDRHHFWSLHGGGANFLFADCSARFIPYSTSRKVMDALATRNGGEPVELTD